MPGDAQALELPPKPYCEWDNPDGYRHALIMNGNDPRLIVFIGGQSLNIDDPRIVCSVGAIAWGREVKRLKRWRKAWNKLANISLLYNRKEYNYANVRLVLVYGKIYSAHAQEAAWRAEGGR